MPSKSPEQAKTMSAIAHGWKPKGSAKGIPVKVAKEFHAADKGKKWGAKGPKPKGNSNRMNKVSSKPDSVARPNNYDRSGHYPGNPGFNREGKPPYRDFDAGAHAKQPKGKSIGAGPPSTKPPIANIKPGADPMGRHHGEVAYTGPADRGSRLVEQPNGPQGHRQPGGKSIGAGTKTARVGEGMGKGSGAFRGMTSNPLHCHNGGHRIGCKK